MRCTHVISRYNSKHIMTCMHCQCKKEALTAMQSAELSRRRQLDKSDMLQHPMPIVRQDMSSKCSECWLA